MLYFPQLLSGAATHFPTARRSVRRTIVNTSIDGSTLKLVDPGWSSVEWKLELRGLLTEEWNVIESLFHAAEGRLGSFTFLDPTDNLLAWSEDLSAGVWVKDSSLQLSPDIPDPLGSQKATRISNVTQSPLTIQQALDIPSWYQYCLSLYARSDQSTQISLFRSTTTTQRRESFRIGPVWARIEHSGKLADSSELINFGMELEGGQTLEVFGWQLENQMGASRYKKTLARSGVYASASFQDDFLSVTTEGPDQHSCLLRIRAQAQD
jgi:hypothetical protein